MATGNPLQSPFGEALQYQQDQGPLSCPYLGHDGQIFENFQQFLDHAKIDHRSDFDGLDIRQSRAKLREVSNRFRSDNSSVATAGDRSAPDIGGFTSDSEKEARGTSSTFRRKLSAPTDHEFTGRKGQAPSHVGIADPDYSRHTLSPYQTTPEPSNRRSTDA
ncbi:hypothetical protein TUN199_11781, partial [Pyrenophora tritici-repentis]